MVYCMGQLIWPSKLFHPLQTKSGRTLITLICDQDRDTISVVASLFLRFLPLYPSLSMTGIILSPTTNQSCFIDKATCHQHLLTQGMLIFYRTLSVCNDICNFFFHLTYTQNIQKTTYYCPFIGYSVNFYHVPEPKNKKENDCTCDYSSNPRRNGLMIVLENENGRQVAQYSLTLLLLG